jgi:hypothetical protein
MRRIVHPGADRIGIHLSTVTGFEQCLHSEAALVFRSSQA